MKATVMEIYKNYCIVITGDGQFLKYKTAASSVEIGDEVVISKAPEARTARLVVRGFAIAAAVVVVAIGSVFSYRYLSKFYPVGGVRELAEAGFEDKEVYQTEALVEEAATKEAEEETATVEVEPGESALGEVNETGRLIYEKDFVIEEGIEVGEPIGDMHFKYETFESDGKKKVLISFKNTSESLSFTGGADIILLSGDTILKKQHIKLVDLGAQKEKEVIVMYEKGTTILRLRLSGGFN